MIARRVVVFPAPLRPTRQTTSRSRTSRVRRRRMWLDWMKTSMPSTVSMTLPIPPHPALSPFGGEGRGWVRPTTMSTTRASARIAAGVASASTFPWWSATMRSE